MPREVLNPDPAEAGIIVGWERDKYVQIGLEVPIDPAPRPATPVSDDGLDGCEKWGLNPADPHDHNPSSNPECIYRRDVREPQSIPEYLYGWQTEALGRALCADRSVAQDIHAALDTYLDNRHKTSGEEAADMDMIGRFIVAALHGVHDERIRSLWATPSRKTVNDLIRLLRKARDAAYGKDE